MRENRKIKRESHGEREKEKEREREKEKGKEIDKEVPFLTFARFAMNPNCNAMKQLQIGVQHYNFFMLHRARKKMNKFHFIVCRHLKEETFLF